MSYDIIINIDYCFNSNLLKQNDEREKKKCDKRILEVAGKLGNIYIHKNAKMMVSFSVSHRKSSLTYSLSDFLRDKSKILNNILTFYFIFENKIKFGLKIKQTLKEIGFKLDEKPSINRCIYRALQFTYSRSLKEARRKGEKRKKEKWFS